MKARLLYWHKARLQGRYILEMKLHRVERSARCPEGIRYRLICIDERTGRRLLMDNHHPKGPHVHRDGLELPYRYADEQRLVSDFRAFVFEFLGVKI